MQPQPTDPDEHPPAEPIAVKNGVLVLFGYGLSIRVERGQLEVRDGIGRQRREGRIHRATGRLRRLVVIGHTGSISLEAIRWLADVGAGYLHIDADGRVLAAFGPQGTDRSILRRAQARAMDNPVGIEIARELLRRKLSAQADTLSTLGRVVEVDPDLPAAIRNLAEALDYTPDVPGLRLIEARAALSYWGAWSNLPMRFARRDQRQIPKHWLTFGSRTSPLTGGPRLAANPINCLTNYVYAILEGQASIAARIVGLDPGLGFIHADQLNRDSLAADLMEPVRPAVDRYVIDMLGSRTFAASDFFETRAGVCRVTTPLARELAATAPTWHRLVGTVAEDVARILERRAPEERAQATPISGRNRSAGRGPRAKGRRKEKALQVARSCVWCGGQAAVGRRTCSTACRAAVDADNLPAFVASGERNLAERRALGLRSELTGAGRASIGGRAAETVQLARDWQRTHPWPTNLAEFERDVLPRLSDVPARALAEATGLSLAYCRDVKKGHVTPHPMWWEALRTVRPPSDAGRIP